MYSQPVRKLSHGMQDNQILSDGLGPLQLETFGFEESQNDLIQR